MTTSYLLRVRPPSSYVYERSYPGWFECLERSFGCAWLEAEGDNVVQRLWKRRDVVATAELASLGAALTALDAYPQWCKSQLTHAKGDDVRNAKAALFEIMALGQLRLFGSGELKPAPESQRAFDAQCLLGDGRTVAVSLKRFGEGLHARTAGEQAAVLFDGLRRLIRARNLDHIGLVMEAGHYPNPPDWKALRHAFDANPELLLVGEDRHMVGDVWTVQCRSVRGSVFRALDGHGTHTFQMLVRHHRNEVRNLWDKLTEACADMAVGGPAHTKADAHVVYVHLPESANAAECASWIEEWFAERPKTELERVLLYQPTVVRVAGVPEVHHFFTQVLRLEFGHFQAAQSRSSTAG